MTSILVKAFNTDIVNFKNYGSFSSSFDSLGNLILSNTPVELNQAFVNVPLNYNLYDKSRFITTYNVNFQQFIPQLITGSNSSSLNSNSIINNNNTASVSIASTTPISMSAANTNAQYASQIMADRSQIVNLRIQLGQGLTPNDFSNVFPYLATNNTSSI